MIIQDITQAPVGKKGKNGSVKDLLQRFAGELKSMNKSEGYLDFEKNGFKPQIAGSLYQSAKKLGLNIELRGCKTTKEVNNITNEVKTSHVCQGIILSI